MVDNSFLVFFVSQDSQFARMLNDTITPLQNVILLSFNQIEECIPFAIECPKRVIIHLNHQKEISDTMISMINKCRQISPNTSLHFVLPNSEEFFAVEGIISESNVIFKNGDLFRELKDLILS